MEAVAEKQFRGWLARLGSGCRFAAQIAKGLQRARFYEPLDGTVEPDDVAGFLDACGIEERVAVLLFPHARDDETIVDIILALNRHGRWHASIDPATARDASEIGVRLRWTTANNFVTHAMGFAPSLRMPATRHAPCVAIAAWTGTHANPLRKRVLPSEVTMGDAPPRMTAEDYRRAFEKTKQLTAEMGAGDVGVAATRNLAFRFARASVGRGLSSLPIIADAR